MKKIIVPIIIVLIVISLVFFFSKRHKSIKNQNEGVGFTLDQSKLEYRNTAHLFHPDSVIGFSWISPRKTLKYERPNRSSEWTPHIENQHINKLLRILATANLSDLAEDPGEPVIEVEIKFSNGVVWTAGWNQNYLWWMSGNEHGKGLKTKGAIEQIYFLSGEHFDRSEKWKWAKSNISKVEIKTPGKLSQPVEGFPLQKWFSANFMTEAVFLDSKIGDIVLPKDHLSLIIQYDDSSMIEVQVYSDIDLVYWVPSKELIYSPRFVKSLSEIRK